MSPAIEKPSPQGPPLARYYRNDFSQAGEDGIIEQILRVLPASERPWCVEFGAWDGEHLSNTARLVRLGYCAVLIEADPARFAALEAKFADNPKVVCQPGFVRFDPPDSLDERLARTDIPADFDVLSIDIDGNDYHVWEATQRYRPRVVVIEFNPTIDDDVDYVQPRSMPVQRGCSALALTRLGAAKGYQPVAITTNNVIFVDAAYFPLFRIEDNSVRALRTDRSLVTHIFYGYDGTVLTSGNDVIPWHQVRLSRGRLQHLPAWLRAFPDNYNPLQRLAYRVLRRVRNALAGPLGPA
jgi:hypothetical protein